ncbi:MAG: discoidin domain-containing protein [Phycisphaerae bacterium]|nr:discoidin domain-containing protein [Phycisphaerae bacterium]
MRKRVIQGVAVSLALLGAALHADVWTDGFDAPRDYLTAGVAPGWDGFLTELDGATVNKLNASQDRPGSLYMESANSFWEGAFNPRGPFVYKLVAGDFIATVRVADFPGMPGSASGRTTHADSFLMARVANLDDAGAGEDAVCMHYFPTWSGNLRRNINNGGEQEQGATNDGFNCATYLQIQRVGNVFTFRRSTDGVTWTTVGGNDGTITRDDMDGLTLQVGLAQCMYSTNTGYVAWDDFRVEGPSIKSGGKSASAPIPASGADDVPVDEILSWKPADGVAKHDVYFGTVSADVNAATVANPGNVLVGPGQDANTYDPAGLFAYGQTYYWRVDEVNATPDATVFKGGLWSFTAEPYAYPVTPILATASSSSNANTGPAKTINGSGLTGDAHSTILTDMWLSGKTPQPAWIQYEFDQAYKLHQMWVWNSNQITEPDIGYGAKEVTVETSTDGSTWTPLANVPEFAQASGLADYVANTVVNFGGVAARFVKLTIHSNWGGMVQQRGLSEVRFLSAPVLAREPKPLDGAANVSVSSALNWRPGRTAAKHDVYFGTDPNALALTKTLTEHEVALKTLGAEYGRTYYWRVDEVNETATPAVWEGPVWSFSTPEYLVVDDFEAYNDVCSRVYYVWKGGAGNSENVDCGVTAYSGNGTGSVVGNDNPPYAERTLVHSGRQAMPLGYTGDSEATRTFSAAQDWTAGGIKTLVLFFRGDPANGAGQVYVKINNTKVSYSGNASAIAKALWTQWNIDLTGVPGLQAVQSLTLGVSGSGSGKLLIDDIRLYREAPPVPVPTDPGTTGLAAYYTFTGDARDSAGTYHGTAVNDPTYVESQSGMGQGIRFDGVNDYVDLPIGSLISTLTSATVATWVNVDAANAGAWERVFDFGTSDTAGYMFLTPSAGTSGVVRFAISKTTGGAAESTVTSPARDLTGWHHMAVVIDGAARTIQLYLDGEVVATNATATLPADLGQTPQNWLGRSQYAADGYLTATLDEFRIYRRVLSAGEVLYLAGAR